VRPPHYRVLPHGEAGPKTRRGRSNPQQPFAVASRVPLGFKDWIRRAATELHVVVDRGHQVPSGSTEGSSL
jgi:hypothetical protein